jgi:hypothetical protein
MTIMSATKITAGIVKTHLMFRSIQFVISSAPPYQLIIACKTNGFREPSGKSNPDC